VSDQTVASWRTLMVVPSREAHPEVLWRALKKRVHRLLAARPGFPLRNERNLWVAHWWSRSRSRTDCSPPEPQAAPRIGSRKSAMLEAIESLYRS